MSGNRSVNAAGDAARDALPKDLGWVYELYEVASAPDSWQRFLARVCDMLDASVAAIVVRGARQDAGCLLALHVRGTPDAIQSAELRRRQADGVSAPLRVLSSLTSDHLASRPVFSTSIDRQDPDCLFKQLDMRHLLIARGVEDGDKLSFMAVGRAADQPEFGASDIALLEALLPHLQRAIQLANMFDQMRASVKASATVLDLITVGVVLFDEYGELALANEPARRILDPDSKILRQLSAELAKMRDPSQDAKDQTPEARILSLGGQNTGHPLFAIVWDIPNEFRDRPHTLAFIVNPAQEHNISIDQVALRRLYGLTSTESRVAALLAKGNSVTEIAEHLGNTAYTIRTHLRHIFDKTGTARQVDLVHLLLRSLVALQIPSVPRHDQPGT